MSSPGCGDGCVTGERERSSAKSRSSRVEKSIHLILLLVFCCPSQDLINDDVEEDGRHNASLPCLHLKSQFALVNAACEMCVEIPDDTDYLQRNSICSENSS